MCVTTIIKGKLVEKEEESSEHETGSFCVSKELMTLIEAVLFYNYFINSFEETMLYHLYLEPVSVAS